MYSGRTAFGVRRATGGGNSREAFGGVWRPSEIKWGFVLIWQRVTKRTVTESAWRPPDWEKNLHRMI